MPHGLKLKEEYGDDLAVLFVEVQGTSPLKTEAFVLAREWMGSDAMWTNERPFSLGIRGIPQFALLGPTGEIVLSGHNSALQSQMDDAIEDLVKSLRKGPDGLPRAVAKAWAEMGKGKYGKALEKAEELLAEGGDDEVVEAAGELRDMLTARVKSRLERIDWMIANGHPLDAKEQLASLEDAVDGRFGIEEELAALEARFASDELAAELKAGKDLARIEKKLFDDPDEKHLKSLEKLIAEHSGTKVAERAKELLKVSRVAVQG